VKYIYLPCHVLATGLLTIVTSLKLCSLIFLCMYVREQAHTFTQLAHESEELHYELDVSDLYKRIIYANDKPVK